MRQRASGRAGGKVILLGEHAVVHGGWSLAMALEKGVEVTAFRAGSGCRLSIPALKRNFAAGDGSREGEAMERLVRVIGAEGEGMELEASMEIPAKAGLGSSAALAAAAARAMASLLDRDVSAKELFEAVQASERVFHGNPSGLDATVAIGGGMVAFSRSAGARRLSAEIPRILVFDSGQKGDTREMVSRFAARLQQTAEEGRSRLERVFRLAERGIEAVERGNLADLGRAMYENHGELAWFGMSTPKLDRIVESAMKVGALGAKLTGGGGGGCAVVLIERSDDAVEARLCAEGLTRVNV